MYGTKKCSEPLSEVYVLRARYSFIVLREAIDALVTRHLLLANPG